jgi:5-formyltetrahydrofolate cyclo-ligase
MTHTATPHPKTDLRRRAAQQRAEAAVRSGASAAAALAGHAAHLGLAAGTVVAGYWPLGDEIDPRPLMTALAGSGCSLALPVVVGKGEALLFRAWAPGDRLEAGGHGTRHPSAQAPVLRPGVVLAPLLAFDRRGFRLGYGGGYYDRTLAELRRRGEVTAIGLGFAAQELAALPSEPWDQTLDMILTECGLIAVERA